jgi:hypothetical protein
VIGHVQQRANRDLDAVFLADRAAHQEQPARVVHDDGFHPDADIVNASLHRRASADGIVQG